MRFNAPLSRPCIRGVAAPVGPVAHSLCPAIGNGPYGLQKNRRSNEVELSFYCSAGRASPHRLADEQVNDRTKDVGEQEGGSFGSCGPIFAPDGTTYRAGGDPW
jgi:hypothetical protein